MSAPEVRPGITPEYATGNPIERTHVPDPRTDRLAAMARDLRRIAYLGSRGEEDPDGARATLLEQAISRADDQLMPGGLAMVALAPVSNVETYGHKLDSAEQAATARAFRLGLDPRKAMPEVDDDDDWEPPLQTLGFWSEGWRRERGMEYIDRPTVNSEASFLRLSLEWAWDNELHLDDFEADVRKTKARLEALLSEGSRAVARGVQCLYDECGAQRLIRTTVAVRDPDTEEKIWVLTDWHCPNCERSYTEEEYERNVYAALHRDKSVLIEVLDEAGGWAFDVWCTPELAAKRVSRSIETIRTWMKRGEIAESCAVGDEARKKPRRLVRLADVQHRHALAVQRWEQRQAAITARLAGSVKVTRR